MLKLILLTRKKDSNKSYNSHNVTFWILNLFSENFENILILFPKLCFFILKFWKFGLQPSIKIS